MNQTAEVANQVANNAPIAAQQNGTWAMIAYCVAIIVILYLFFVRPNKKRMEEYQKMLDGVKVGSRVLAAGIYGTVKKVNENTINMEIAKGVVIEVNKHAIASVE